MSEVEARILRLICIIIKMTGIINLGESSREFSALVIIVKND